MRNLEKFYKSLPTPIRYLEEYDCYIKEEYTLPSGSHKDRETVYLTENETRDCLCVTTGNAGISLAYYLGEKAHIVVPKSCSVEKMRILYELGADIIEEGKNYSEAWRRGIEIACEKNWRNLSPGIERLRHYGDMVIAGELYAGFPNYVFVPSANHTLAYGISMGFTTKPRVVSCVLPNHPFLGSSRIELLPNEIEGYGSISTSIEAMETRYLGRENAFVDTVSRKVLRRVRDEHRNGKLDLAVYLALEVSQRYKGTKVVIATGVRR